MTRKSAQWCFEADLLVMKIPESPAELANYWFRAHPRSKEFIHHLQMLLSQRVYHCFLF